MIDPSNAKIEKCAINTARYKNLKDVPQGVCQETDKFFDPSDETIKWSLHLFPNGFPLTDPDSMDGAVSLRLFYHGQEKVSARFVFEICRNREEFRNEAETLIKQETENYYCFSSSDLHSLDIPNFISHKVLFDPKFKLLPFNTLFLRVKVYYHFVDKVDEAPEQPPINCVSSNDTTIISNDNEEIKRKIEKCAINTARYKNLKDIPQGFCQETDKFFDPSDGNIKWSLHLFANGYPSTDPDSMDGAVSLRMIYHGQEKVSARFVFEICRNREEFRNEVETFLKQETERYCFSSIIKSLDIPNFLSHEILFDPKFKLLPFNTLFLRVKVFYNVDDAFEQPPVIDRTPLNHNTFITLVFNNEEIPNVPVLPLRKCSKLFDETLKDTEITHLGLNNLDPAIFKLILSFIFAEASFYEYLERNPNDEKLRRYAKKLQIDDLIKLFASFDVQKAMK